MITKVKTVNKLAIIFDNGIELSSYHEDDCCESHDLTLSDLTINDFEGLEFDLSKDNFFERVEGYGIRLIPLKGHSVPIPGHGWNNGYYSDKLELVLTNPDGTEYKKFDITECQKIEEN